MADETGPSADDLEESADEPLDQSDFRGSAEQPQPAPAEVQGSVKPAKNDNRLAMISVVATLIVAVVGSVTTLAAATMNERSTGRQADEDFRRTHQQVAYAEYQSGMVVIESSINQLLGRMRVDPKHLPPEQELIASLQDIQPLITKVQDKFSVVSIVGSYSTFKLAKDWLSRCVDAVKILASAITEVDGKYSVNQTKLPAANDKMMEAAKLEGSFLDGARHDVNPDN